MTAMKSLISKVLLGLSIFFVGCYKPDNSVVLQALWSQVTIYSKFPGHEIKGRGTLLGYGVSNTSILTAKHVVNMFPGNVYITVVDLNGKTSEAKIVYLYNCSDMAMISVNTRYDSAPHFRTPDIGSKVFAFQYPKETDFYDATIPSTVNGGRVLSGPTFTPGLWEPPALVELGTYTNHSGMSGEGVFDENGNLVGVHSAINVATGLSVFVPIEEALNAEYKDGFKGERNEKNGCK
jgi:S1-C subfamily serine protease